MTDESPARRMLHLLARGLLVVLVALGIASLLAYFGVIGGLGDIDIPEGARRLEGTIRSVLPEKREWQAVGRITIMDYPLDLYTLEAFGPLGTGGLTKDGQAFLRARVQGKFAADPMKGAVFAVLDEKNYQRLQQGYPPVVHYSAEPGQEINAELPGFGYMLLFVRRQEESRVGLPSTLGELLLFLFQLSQQQKQQAQPVKVSADLYYVIECYCTDFEMKEARRIQQR